MSPLLIVALMALNTPHTARLPVGAGIQQRFAPLAGIAIAQSPSAAAAHDDAGLRALIDSGIAMLQTGDYRAFLERFVSPEYRQSKSVDAMLEEFQREKADILLSVLKEIHRKKPVYADSDTNASFKLKHRPHMPNAITFELHDGLWYIRN